MGTLTYSPAGVRIDFDDRTLAHLKVVIITKLRRNEPFLFTWVSDGVPESLWFHPTIPIRFRFDSTEPEQMNPAWLERLMMTANSGAGLRIVDEDDGPEPTTAAGVIATSGRKRSSYRSVGIDANRGVALAGASSAA
ncbi:hypothetical protein SAMN05428970_2552 [Agromyces sp. CF514]|uniref:DUF7882 family protein n=1 Tax=Agromyces sp. CF514 TaxID=1881031 RepID=UPI0008EA85A9|nr:hypothetical protein SAMN05428970_2552 [Agromyces sp. CF514]